MTFNDDAEIDTSRIESGSSGLGRGGLVLGGGGGILGVVALVLYMVLNNGAPPPSQPGANGAGSGLNGSRVSGGGKVGSIDVSRCKTGADAKKDDACLVMLTENSLFGFWTEALPKQTANKSPLQPPKINVYSGTISSACGPASNQVGPFYCPADKKIYIDASFFELLQSRFGSSGGPLAKQYVVAHEYGHAIQDQLGVLAAAHKDPKGPASGGVKTELMADCLAGMWAKAASTTKDKNGRPVLQPMTDADIDAALSAASAVGDDRIQKASQGRVSPENFTHGTSEQRKRWFMKGYDATSMNMCNTLQASTL
ncbi:hypothetical protein KEM60_00514 [Austwickia sp. TVS 96-490-7B]|uniref:KPN_02809 family neutral zinc metallopeptidase n=1 Tax=Austwickia sp. TVS 96-490-7B TaxID=2830843 RepID=UPI001C561199|nr:neutral zinc metallopeptidase [Austwickia sp. TVS 96-490-7B]MBW3084327.1 hypothetical protein [Austwickia sp. TVS 96-490-7B]